MHSLLLVAPFYSMRENPEGIQLQRVVDLLNDQSIEIFVLDLKTLFITHRYNPIFHLARVSFVALKVLEKYGPKFIREILYVYDPITVYNHFFISSAKKIITNSKIENLLTSSTPFSIHNVGFKLKELYNLTWIVRLSDPYFNNPYSKLSYAKLITITRVKQQKVHLKSDYTIVSNSIYADIIRKEFNLGHKVKVIHHTHFPSSISLENRSTIKNRETIGIYTGNIYGLRDGTNLLMAILQLESIFIDYKVRIDFYGKVPKFYFSRFGTLIDKGLIRFNHQVVQSEILELINKSDFAINLEADINPNPFFPSKLPDYLFLNKPLLNISPRESEIYKFLGNQNFSASPNDVEEIKNVLTLLIINLDSNHAYDLNELSNNRISEKYMEILDGK